MSDADEMIREIIELLRTEENMEWSDVAEHYELCHSCGGVPQGNVYKDMPFKECDSNDCDRAFEQMCDDFEEETVNGNSFRCLVGWLYDLIVEHGDAEEYLAPECDEAILNSENPLLRFLNTWDRESLNSSIVSYWRDDRYWRDERKGDAQ